MVNNVIHKYDQLPRYSITLKSLFCGVVLRLRTCQEVHALAVPHAAIVHGIRVEHSAQGGAAGVVHGRMLREGAAQVLLYLLRRCLQASTNRDGTRRLAHGCLRLEQIW